MRTYINQLTDIPKEEVREIVQSFARDGAISIVSKPMKDGTWVVTAEFLKDDFLEAAATSTAA